MKKQTRRVAVLGGGMSALTAAYELTRPELDGAFEVTVYQQGWRLGGKGASGRNPHRENRIEEHGLHVWMGFYENAFRLIRDCYERLHREPGTPLATWQDAFKPHSYIVFDDVDPTTGAAKRWPLCFPEDGPGGPTPGDGAPLLTPPEYVPRILSLIVMLLRNTAPTQHLVPSTEHSVSVVARLEEVVVRVESLVRLPMEESLARLAEMLESAMHLAHHLPGLEPAQLDDVYKRIAQVVSHLTAPVFALLGDESLRHTRLLFDFAVTHLRGFVADGLLLPPFDFSRVDDLDYREWLRKHGAQEETITSAPVTALYDLVFAVDTGMAAGATLSCAARMMLTYKGALFYKMQAGMGDTVFTPLYLELQKRGVKFHFFHRVDELKLAFDAASDNFVVDSIVIGRQAATLDGKDYQPLVDVKGVACWPTEPHWTQLERGDELARGDELTDGGFDLESHATKWQDALPPLTLRRGDDGDFDDVVLGISVAALPRITADLMKQVPQFQRMVDGIKTIRTQATQLWFKTDLAGLGWTDPGSGRCAGTAPIAGSYPESLDTWADMTHLVPREGTPDGAVGNIAYFCGQLRDGDAPGVPDGATAAVWDKAINKYSARWTAEYMRSLLPAFDVEKLYSSNSADKGAALWDAQYFRANVKPSEQYVLTVPGSTVFRLYADDLVHLKPGCANLFLAGDWVRTGINGGCIEAATMAGMQAARALSGSYFEIVGDPAPFRPRPATQSSFIERGGDVVYAEPYMQESARLYAFLVPVDRKRIAAMCDRYLNWTGKMLFTPFLDHVALVFAAIDSTYSTDPLYIGRGTMTESDVSFWVPVRSSSPSAPSLSWFLPYVWVDNGIAMSAGREVFGFPKEAGTLTIPPLGAPARLAVDVAVVEKFGLPPNVGPNGPRAVVRNVISVEPSAGAAAGPPTLAGSMMAMLRTLLPNVLGGSVTAETLSWFLESFNASVPMLFLKQFRDVGDGRRACYKALVTANSTPTQIRSGGMLPGSYDLTIRGFASHPIVRDLGLGRPEDAEAILRGCSGFFVDFDFLMEQGRELWRAI